MSDFVFAHELNDEAFEAARARFVREEAQSWVLVQMRPAEHAVAGVCRMLGLRLDAQGQSITIDAEGFEQQLRDVLAEGDVVPDRYVALLQQRLPLLAKPSAQTLQRFFPESHEDDVIEVTRVLQGLDRSAEGEALLQAIAKRYEHYLQAARSDYRQQTESPRWFIELSNDWEISYHQDGSVAEDPQLD